ncbi:capsid maturation protease [Gordonia phage Nedarya]|nr:capsid maturation protease [Gordonia phage Nedarya]
MTPEEYAAAQAVISASVASYVQRFASLFATPALTLVEWLRLLEILFPTIQRQYEESAALARDFYDTQRELHLPGQRNEMLLSELQWEWFVENMEPARRGMLQANSPQAAVTQLTLRAIREVEMAGRRQIIGSVKNDPDPNSVQGWARVATGNETCAWCLMLISRGPTYLGATNSGLDLDDYSAAQAFNKAGGDLEKFREDVGEYMEQWHAGCDCLVVPVFDKANWPGRASQKRAEQLWIEATREAQQLIDSGKARSQNLNKETQNALRRRIYSGDLSMSSYALAA